MAEETPDQQNIQVALDEREMRTAFANAYRIYQTAEEVIVDFGFNMMHPNAQNDKPQMLLKINDRQIMSWPTVKRLSQSLRAADPALRAAIRRNPGTSRPAEENAIGNYE